jgi:hypothetical protein
MFTLRRRSAFRPILILFLFGSVVFLAGYLKDLAFLSANPPVVKTVHKSPSTITRTRTEWAETTRVVEATTWPKESRQQTPLPDNLASPLQQHRYRSDGLLEVNPDGPHPIFELIQNAEAEWEAKLATSSKTLTAAVAEYERRYKRPPPLGFDDWYVLSTYNAYDADVNSGGPMLKKTTFSFRMNMTRYIATWSRTGGWTRRTYRRLSGNGKGTLTRTPLGRRRMDP